MSELRSLLNTENKVELERRVCGRNSTQWGNGWGNVLLDGFTNYYSGNCWTGNNDESYRQWCHGFCIIPGVTTVQFEIWGGGGGPAGGCCCVQGNPSGSGAYAMKTLCACDLGVDTLGGFCYLVCVGATTTCSSNCVGNTGCKSFITGCGLTNFCAEGGMAGRHCCYIFYSQMNSANLTGCYAQGGTGSSIWNSAGCYTLDPVSGSCYYCDCACYYGADFGVPGRLGWFRVDCTCGNLCFVRAGMPQPGGVRDRCTRYVISSFKGNACCNESTFCKMGEFPGNAECGRGMFGQGLAGATSCNNGCCISAPGTGGLVRITYK
jgi:hypothetical protein